MTRARAATTTTTKGQEREMRKKEGRAAAAAVVAGAIVPVALGSAVRPLGGGQEKRRVSSESLWTVDC